ncbi:MAG: lysoplasmalogenase [Deltaproteobacteria bacterium]|nr:lysoplasmalogenase [Deltaproteobacteria bacterium]MBI3387187.1 lysoplasmalogenase [Deltaproteobacteria bacterium]
MAILSLLAFLGLAIADWIAVSQESRMLEYVTKPAALGALLIYAATGAHCSVALLTALVLSLLGDVFLMLPVDLFAAGLGSFLLAHVAYIADFNVASTPRVLWWLVVVAAASPLIRRIMRAVSPEALRPAVGVYTAVISLMVASAIASGSLLAGIGALLFFASDGIIAWDRFVQKLSWARVAIIATYHLGQLGLVLALR